MTTEFKNPDFSKHRLMTLSAISTTMLRYRAFQNSESCGRMNATKIRGLTNENMTKSSSKRSPQSPLSTRYVSMRLELRRDDEKLRKQTILPCDRVGRPGRATVLCIPPGRAQMPALVQPGGGMDVAEGEKVRTACMAPRYPFFRISRLNSCCNFAGSTHVPDVAWI